MIKCLTFFNISYTQRMRNELYKREKKEGQEPQRDHLKRDNLYIKARAYFLMYKQRHLTLIETTIEKYREKQDYQRLVAALNFALGPLNHTQILGLRASALSIMKTILSSAIEEELQNMTEKERIRYSKIHQRSVLLQSQAKLKMAKQSKINFEITSLFYQDILSLLLQQSKLYDQYCSSHQSPLFYNDELAQLLGFFKIQDIKKLKIHFLKNIKFITIEGINQRLVQVIKLCTIIVLRFRVFSILSKIPNYCLLNSSSDLLLKSLEGLQVLKKNQSNPFGYYLSELSIFMFNIETIHVPFSWKNGLVSLLKEVAKTQSIQEKKQLLLKTKIKYNLFLETLVLFLNYIEQNAEEKIHYLFKFAIATQSDYQKFVQALPYIFLKNDSYADAFEQRGFNEKFQITHGTEGTVKCMPIIKGLIIQQAAYSCVEYGLNQIQLMNMEKLSSKVLAIKKYNFTYNEMKEEFATLPEKDIPITFILGTIDDQIIFYELFFKTISEEQFISAVQKLVLLYKIPYRFIILLHFYNDYTPLARSSQMSLLKLAKMVKTKLYISNLSDEFSENIFLFAYIYSQVAQLIRYHYQVFVQHFPKDIDQVINKIKKLKQPRLKTNDRQCQTIQ